MCVPPALVFHCRFFFCLFFLPSLPQLNSFPPLPLLLPSTSNSLFQPTIQPTQQTMAARFLDMALDDVAKSRASNNRSPAGGRGGRGGRGSGRDSPNSRPNRSSPYSVRAEMADPLSKNSNRDYTCLTIVPNLEISAQHLPQTIVGPMTSLRATTATTATTLREAAEPDTRTATKARASLRATKETQRLSLKTCTMP